MKKKTFIILIVLVAITALVVLGAILLPDVIMDYVKHMHGG